MFSRFCRVLAAVFTIALLSGAPGFCPAASAAQTLKLVTGDDYKPFTDRNLPDGGMDTLIVKRAFALAGVDVEVSFQPWKRGWFETVDRTFDATFPYSVTPERLEKVIYSDPIYTLESRLFVRKDSSLDLTGPEQFDGQTICYPQGYALRGYFDTLSKSNRIYLQRPVSMSDCFRMLKSDRVDLVGAQPLQGSITAREVFGSIDAVRTLDIVMASGTNCLVVSKEHPHAQEIIDAFNKGLAALKKSGEYGRIVDWFTKAYLDGNAS